MTTISTSDLFSFLSTKYDDCSPLVLIFASDVFGATETKTVKTLSFGLQRLLIGEFSNSSAVAIHRDMAVWKRFVCVMDGQISQFFTF